MHKVIKGLIAHEYEDKPGTQTQFGFIDLENISQVKIDNYEFKGVTYHRNIRLNDNGNVEFMVSTGDIVADLRQETVEINPVFFAGVFYETYLMNSKLEEVKSIELITHFCIQRLCDEHHDELTVIGELE